MGDRIITIRELSRNPGAVIEALSESAWPLIITRRGRPIAQLLPISDDDRQDFLLANAPEFVSGMREVDEALAAGHPLSMRAADDVFAELEQELLEEA